MTKTDDDTRVQWKKAMGARLAKELLRLGLTQTEIARTLTVTKQLVNHWVTGRSELTSWQLLLLDKLGVDVVQVLFGRNTGARVKMPAAMVPYPTREQMIAIGAGILDVDVVDRMLAVLSPLTCGIAVDVDDPSLEPRLPRSAVAIFDRDRSPAAGDICCVVLRATTELLIRKYEPGRGKTFALTSINKLIPNREISADHDPIVVGTLAETVLVASR
jgi:hypothetical protein